MNVLVTGNNGYIGSMLTDFLLKRGYSVRGLDTNYFRGCEFDRTTAIELEQINKDIREVSRDDLEGIDAIIHLAAISNDPVGALKPEITHQINYEATVRLAKLSKKLGIQRFIYASSCSMYGIVRGDRVVDENSPLAPVTEYAKSKVKSEKALLRMADKHFSPVFLRAGTVYGIAPMLRCDLVVNNLVGWAHTTHKIRIMSDGTPWRPTIHVEDVCRAYLACLEAPLELIHAEAFNVGRNEENHQIRDIADKVKSVVPDCEVEYTYEHGPDTRSYKVNFDKISTVLRNFFHPCWNVEMGIRQIYEAYKAHGLTYEEFTGNKYIRLNQIKKLLHENKLDDDLFWRSEV